MPPGRVNRRVQTGPGETAFTLTRGANCFAKAFRQMQNADPAQAVIHRLRFGLPAEIGCDIHDRRGPDRLHPSRSARRAPMQPIRLMSNARAQRSSVNSANGAGSATPRLFTRISGGLPKT